MKYILCSLIIWMFCFNMSAMAIDDEPDEISCSQVSSVLLKQFKHAYSGKISSKRIRVDTRNIAAQGDVISLHIEFCRFLEENGYKRKAYKVKIPKELKKNHRKWVYTWISTCRIPVPEILTTTRVLEIVVNGNEYYDSFYKLDEGDPFFNHHRYRGEGHKEFFEYILKKHRQELYDNYQLLSDW